MSNADNDLDTLSYASTVQPSTRSDKSAAKSRKLKELSERLRLESQSHQETGECYRSLQAEYDKLLKKHAQAENVIDKLRIEARVQLCYDSPRLPTPDSVFTAGRCLSVQQMSQQAQHMMQGEHSELSRAFSVPGNLKITGWNGLTGLPLDSSVKGAEVGFEALLRRLQEHIDAFQSSLGEEGSSEGEMGGIYEHLKESHRQLGERLKKIRDSPESSSRESLTDIDLTTYEDELERLGMRLDEIADELGISKMKNQFQSMESLPLRSSPYASSSDGSEIVEEVWDTEHENKNSHAPTVDPSLASVTIMDGKYLESSGNGLPLLRDEYSKTLSMCDDENGQEDGYEEDDASPRSGSFNDSYDGMFSPRTLESMGMGRKNSEDPPKELHSPFDEQGNDSFDASFHPSLLETDDLSPMRKLPLKNVNRPDTAETNEDSGFMGSEFSRNSAFGKSMIPVRADSGLIVATSRASSYQDIAPSRTSSLQDIAPSKVSSYHDLQASKPQSRTPSRTSSCREIAPSRTPSYPDISHSGYIKADRYSHNNIHSQASDSHKRSDLSPYDSNEKSRDSNRRSRDSHGRSQSTTSQSSPIRQPSRVSSRSTQTPPTQKHATDASPTYTQASNVSSRPSTYHSPSHKSRDTSMHRQPSNVSSQRQQMSSKKVSAGINAVSSWDQAKVYPNSQHQRKESSTIVNPPSPRRHSPERDPRLQTHTEPHLQIHSDTHFQKRPSSGRDVQTLVLDGKERQLSSSLSIVDSHLALPNQLRRGRGKPSRTENQFSKYVTGLKSYLDEKKEERSRISETYVKEEEGRGSEMTEIEDMLSEDESDTGNGDDGVITSSRQNVGVSADQVKNDVTSNSSAKNPVLTSPPKVHRYPKSFVSPHSSTVKVGGSVARSTSIESVFTTDTSLQEHMSSSISKKLHSDIKDLNKNILVLSDLVKPDSNASHSKSNTPHRKSRAKLKSPPKSVHSSCSSTSASVNGDITNVRDKGDNRDENDSADTTHGSDCSTVRDNVEIDESSQLLNNVQKRLRHLSKKVESDWSHSPEQSATNHNHNMLKEVRHRLDKLSKTVERKKKLDSTQAMQKQHEQVLQNIHDKIKDLSVEMKTKQQNTPERVSHVWHPSDEEVASQVWHTPKTMYSGYNGDKSRVTHVYYTDDCTHSPEEGACVTCLQNRVNRRHHASLKNSPAQKKIYHHHYHHVNDTTPPHLSPRINSNFSSRGPQYWGSPQSQNHISSSEVMGSPRVLSAIEGASTAARSMERMSKRMLKSMSRDLFSSGYSEF